MKTQEQTESTKPVFFRVSRVAQMLDVSRPSVYDLIRRGELTGVIRVGTRLRIPQRAIDELIKRGVA